MIIVDFHVFLIFFFKFINSFELYKNILFNDPLLQYPDFTKTFNLTEASNYAIGAVLSQGPVGSDLSIAYASRTLNPAEKKLQHNRKRN